MNFDNSFSLANFIVSMLIFINMGLYQYSPVLFCVAALIIAMALFQLEIKYNFSGKIASAFTSRPELIFVSGKIAGAFCYGVIPVIMLKTFTEISPADYGMTTGNIGEKKTIILLSFTCIIILSYIISGFKNLRTRVIQPGLTELKTEKIAIICSGWLIYLFGYELLFRGILWFVCYREFGFFPALLINLSLYSLAHFYQGFIPALGSIPAGIVFCLMAYISSSLLIPFIAHAVMAISFEIFIMMQNQGFKLNSVMRNQR